MTINTGPGGLSTLFIKKAPEEIQNILQERPDEFCDIEDYRERYHMATPQYYIRKGTRYRLVALGLLTKEQMSIA